METPLNTNFVFTAQRKSDGGWDAIYSGSIEDHCAKMDDVEAGGMHNFLIDHRRAKPASREALDLSPSPTVRRAPSGMIWTNA